MRKKTVIYWKKIFFSDETEMYPKKNGIAFIRKYDEESWD